MNKIKQFGATGILVATLSGFASITANASTVYYYVGNGFTDFDPVSGTSSSLYNNTDKVTVSVTLSSALGANFSGQVSPIAFTISDGRQTFTDADVGPPNVTSFFYFITNASSMIIGWDSLFLLETPNVGNAGIDTINNVPFNQTNSDDGAWLQLYGAGHIFNDPTSWTTSSPSATPVPATLPLLSFGLGMLGLLARRRKQKFISESKA